MARDAREAASDRRSTFGTALTREQIDALSDDPDEMAQQLQDMAGGNAVIRVDSFEGGRLPPKSQIKAIHITRDAFAAENHFAGGLFIDIITQPGIGPLRTNVQHAAARRRAERRRTSVRRPQSRGPSGTQNYNGGFGGSLIKQKASFSINVNGNTSFDTPYLLRTTRRTARWSKALGAAPAARQRVRLRPVRLRDHPRPDAARQLQPRTSRRRKNLGVGGYDAARARLLHRGPRQHAADPGAGPLGRRFFINTRASINWSRHRHRTRSSKAPTIRVHRRVHERRRAAPRRRDVEDASTCSRTSTTCAASTRCAPASSSTAAPTTRTTRRTTSAPTRSRASTRSRPGTPRSYTRRIGDPNIDYKNVQARRLRPGRHPRPQEPDAQPGRALRAADAPVATTTTSGRASASPGRRARAARRRCAAAPASSTTGCRPAPTSRRCASTASASRS